MNQNFKKILFLLHLPPPVHGAAMMGQYIKDSTLVNSSFNSKFVNLSTSDTVDTIGKGSLSKLKRFLGIVFQANKYLNKFKPDVVYITLTATGIGFFKDAFVVFIVKLFKVKVVYHLHNKGVSLKQHKWTYNLIYKFVFKNASVILLSPFLYKDIKKYVPNSRVFYCANGVPEKSSFEKHRKGPADKKVQILFLSNLIESKGVNVLLQACSILQARKVDFICSFVGGEGDISVDRFQKRVIELGVQDVVFYLGRKYDKDKDEVYRQSDIFTLPTYYANECFPLVILEAMQHFLPVVSTPEGGIAGMVKDGGTGFLVQQNNAVDLADKLEYLVLNPDLRYKMGVMGNDYYRQEFTSSKFEHNLVEILNEVYQNTTS